MGFWDNLKNKVDELNDKGEKWFDKNVNQKIKEKKQEYEKELVCKKCGAKLKNNVLKEYLVCEQCGEEQENPKYIFVKNNEQKDENQTNATANKRTKNS